MTDDALRSLAHRVGLATTWTEHTGIERGVTPEALAVILTRLGYACGSSGDVDDSLVRARRMASDATLPPLITHVAGDTLKIPAATVRAGHAALVLESGNTIDVELHEGSDGYLYGPAIHEPGYHQFFLHDRIVTLAVAPRRCFTVEDATQGGKAWGLAAQVYALRRLGDGGIGDFASVSTLVQAAGRRGADALALSPTHALFHADPEHYSPYSPSTRLFRNPLHADLCATFGAARVAEAIHTAGVAGGMNALEANPLIDWPTAARTKQMVLRALYQSFAARELTAGLRDPLAEDFRKYCREAGDPLSDHARFEALHADYLSRGRDRWHWRDWAPEHRDPRGGAVTAFALRNRAEIEYHAFVQWIAMRSQSASQSVAHDAGLRIGLIGDLAVGMHSGGSHAWSRQSEVIGGLAIGAPPDPLAPRGQNWGLTTFSPQGLRDTGFEAFIATLRGMFRGAGGVRIDHVMGLSRLWLVPEGEDANAGAYLSYPFEDMLRLTALESWRHRAIVIGEDLGTVPHGFRERLTAAGVYGMRVMQFERSHEGFHPPQWYTPDAVAMTSTHDLPTVAGWWSGRDLAVREELNQFGIGQTHESESHLRNGAKPQLMSALSDAGVANGIVVDANADEIVRACARFLSRTASRLSLLPVEDVIGQIEQPNLPGTTVEHPNWRRRYDRATNHLLSGETAEATLDSFAQRA